MNEKNTGAFIASLRKERTLTQKQLAERLKVSDKAVSKWETGRGYPDIDSLMALSSYFGVTVNELLMGERLRSEKKEKQAQKSIAAELIDEKKRRRRTYWVVIAVAVLTVGFIITQAFGIKSTISNLSSYLQQDSVCHISADYSSIEICGLPYTRVGRMIDEDRDYTWEQDKLLCDRPMAGDRLSSADKIYSVKFCDNYDYVCLTHESAFDSRYEDAVYCKTEKLEEYRRNTSEGKRVYCIREYEDYNKWKGTELSDSFSQAVDTLTEDDGYNSWYPDGDSYDIYFHYENSPLLYFYGYLGEENGRYFITFSGGVEVSEAEDQNLPKDLTYRLDESVSGELDDFFLTENRR
ncbi:MAG: helix-turn-helix domain-containing protein [Ruminococcus sp.]|nr:helix-turn-helix domain-containing protein [Ruminococcus sp.]